MRTRSVAKDRRLREGLSLSELKIRGLVFPLGVMMGIAAFGDVVVENASCRLTLADEGYAKSLVVKATGEECLLSGMHVPFATLTQNRPYDNEYKLMLPAKPWTHGANLIERRGDELRIGFEDEFDVAVLKIREEDGFLGFELKRIDYRIEDYGVKRKTEIDALSFVRLPLRRRPHFGRTLNVTWDERNAVALVAGRVETRVDADEREDGGLLFWAGTEGRSGILSGSAAIVAAPQADFLDAMDAVERGFGLPRGVASRRDPDITADCYFPILFKPTDLDRHLAAARAGGFGLFLLDITDLVKTTGTYEPTDQYPNGLADFEAIGRKIRAAGLKPALHGYPTKASRTDPTLVGGTVDPRFNSVCELILHEAAAADAVRLVVEGNPRLLRTEDDRRLVQAGNELVAFGGVRETDDENVFVLTNCQRGTRGTKACAHAKGERFRHLDVDDWPIWVRLDPETSATAEHARRIGRIWKAFDPVMFYFDGAEDVPDPYWYYVPRAQLTAWRFLLPIPQYCESALKSHFGWHLNSRGNAFDCFPAERLRTAMKKYTLRCAAQDEDDFTLVNFGWLAMKSPEPEEKTFRLGMQPDHFEYAFSKALAYGCPVTVEFVTGQFERHPHLKDNLDVIRRWSEAKRLGRVSAELKRAMLDPAREFMMVPGTEEADIVECHPVFEEAASLRAFSFVREGRAHIVYWDAFAHEASAIELKCADVRHAVVGGRRIVSSVETESSFVRRFREAMSR